MHSYVLMITGPTPGHVFPVVVNGGDKVFFSGDRIPGMRSYRRGLQDFIFYSKKEALNNILRIKRIKFTVIFQGHNAEFIENDAIDITTRNKNKTNSITRVIKNIAV